MMTSFFRSLVNRLLSCGSGFVSASWFIDDLISVLGVIREVTPIISLDVPACVTKITTS